MCGTRPFAVKSMTTRLPQTDSEIKRDRDRETEVKKTEEKGESERMSSD